ncbi:MAG: DNA translocase FtsK 4TM domain-containing protein [Proteobacteria bacterium]|nr:DNA translocase FtsK 4TM domain-containing protein [Pseudomonadota bacterium]
MKKNKVSRHIRNRLRESFVFLIIPLAAYVLLSLFSYHPQDSGPFSATDAGTVHNYGGSSGAVLADILLNIVGYIAYLIPLGLIFIGWQVYKNHDIDENISWVDTGIKAGGFVLTLLSGCALAFMYVNTSEYIFTGGGIVGEVVGNTLFASLGKIGATLILSAIFLAGTTLFTGMSWIQFADLMGKWTFQFLEWVKIKFEQFQDWRIGKKAQYDREEVRKIDAETQQHRDPINIKPVFTPGKIESKRAVKSRQGQLFDTLPAGKFPPLTLLDEPKNIVHGYSQEELEVLSRQVELKLADFRVKVKVVGVYPGPVVTRFEVEPAAGVKVSQIMNLAKDLARGLSVISVRIVDVIPGKPYVGVEIPNNNREIVYLSEILSSVEFDKSRSPLSLGLGKSISGRPVVVDIAKMPHVLVAGTTGSGKSVAVNAMIVSLLYKATPEEVKMIMVDPKMLELSVYEGIPHLLAPVVTDMKEASNALRWCVAEMERRYKLMAAVGVRNLAGYNKAVKKARELGEPLTDPLFKADALIPGQQPPELDTLPYIVIIIDEFADMMMIVGKKVEELIARLAQKARAAGVHLILATQRPSVDVITGLIKANIPTRIAFQVSSKIDSRTILDQGGAEQLLGHGDMLYLPPGKAIPERVHGAFVDDHEVHGIVNYLTKHYEADYQTGILDEVQMTDDGQELSDTGVPQAPASDVDELYDKAVFVVTESRKVSISYVQRRLRVGYNRAATIVEQLEENGVVSTAAHNGTREVLAPAPVSNDDF